MSRVLPTLEKPLPSGTKEPKIISIILRTDGTTDYHLLPFDWLVPAQTILGGYVEVISTIDNHTLLVDEEGKLKGKPINRIASPMIGVNGTVIVGDAILIFIPQRKLP